MLLHTLKCGPCTDLYSYVAGHEGSAYAACVGRPLCVGHQRQGDVCIYSDMACMLQATAAGAF